MKTRSDFVSNSSSSSYIVAVVPRCTDAVAAQCIAEKAFGDGYESVKDFFEHKTVLTAVEVIYYDWREKTQEWLMNFVPAGICVDDEELDKFFDKNGEVRNDLDPIETIAKLSWHSDDCYGENEEVVYERRLMGKVNEKTLKFTKWIHDKAVELYGDKNAGYDADSEQPAEDLLAAYKKSLDAGNKLYFTRFSYEGDAMCYGHIYIADTGGWKRSIGQRMIDASNNIKDAWFVDS
jgi:hypothetical protein